MLAAVKIKEEPLDEISDMQEIFKQEDEALRKQQINEFSDNFLDHPTSGNNFRIVDEQESIITVSAADMRSEDELQFIDSINNTDPNKFKGVCTKCLKTFTNRGQFIKHTRRNHCITKQKCPVCPVTFVDAPSLLNHLSLHRENQFFCSQHCGANFGTLPLCEEHELREHKLQVAPKIRYKHFCSFCREGFKTELLLHVHWLQQSQGCGKLMQDIVLHSSSVANDYNPNNKNCKNLVFKPQIHSTTTNSVSTIPITKLRLKAAPQLAIPATANKRQITDDGQNEMEMANKHHKSLDVIKKEVETNQLSFNFENEVQIKEEPFDDFETNLTSNLIPEVIIKTEEEEKTLDDNTKMQSLVINNMIIGPQSTGKFIPLESLVSSENVNKSTIAKEEMKTFSINNLVRANINGKVINMNNQNLPVLTIINNNNNNSNIINNNNNNCLNLGVKTEGNLKFLKLMPAPMNTGNKPLNNITLGNLTNSSTGKIMTLKLANKPAVNMSDLKPLPKQGLQIIKFLPNTQIMGLKPNTNLPTNQAPLVIKLQPKPNPAAQATLTKPPDSPLVVNTPNTETSKPTNPIADKTSPTVSIKLNSLEQNTTIDAEDFKKLQAEALIRAEEQRKNFYIPKTRLMIIENIPEKKQLIDSMKQQIAEVETKTTEQIQGKPAGNYILKPPSDEPSTLYLPVHTTLDVELVEARYQNPDYNYKWICPYCLKDYEIKSSLRVHLVKAHNLNTRDLQKINVQAKPYVCEAEEPSGEAIKNPQQEDLKSDIKEEPFIQDCDSQSLTISETESLTTIDSAGSTVSPKTSKITPGIKQPRPRYVCDKCGRTCSSKTMLSDHILANCSREPQYSCKECNKKFYSQGTLQCHMSIHTGELPHKCNYCEKRFRTRGQVKVHHRTHTGERPFFCQVCSQRFTHRETLIAHLSRHIGMKRYKCYGCDKHFSCISALKTHREIRNDTCGKVKFNPRAIGPRVRVIRGNVIFEAQPEINPYLKSEDPKSVLSELQNNQSPLTETS